MAQLLLKQFSEGLMRPIGGWLATLHAADQVSHLVIKPIREDGVRVLGNGIPNDPRLGDARQSCGLSEPSLTSSVEPNAFHRTSVSPSADRCITRTVRKAPLAPAGGTLDAGSA